MPMGKNYRGSGSRMAYLFILSALLLNTCARKERIVEFSFAGQTMGTTYHITLVNDVFTDQVRQTIPAGVDSVLFRIDSLMSTFKPNSEISRFNRWNSLEPFEVSADFAIVADAGFSLCKRSGGAFDVTVAPIVNFYGFGAEPGEDRFPTVKEIDDWLALTGCDRVRLEGNTLIKDNPEVSINLSAIAKGYGADQVVRFLTDQGFKNIFAEVGGEIMTRGLNMDSKPWRIGIDRPSLSSAPGEELQQIIGLKDKAIASSGDYRNYHEIDGHRISHTIDPRSGYPITHNLASVSIIADNCMIADGIATAVMVMGLEEGLNWLEDYGHAEGLLIIRTKDGHFKESMTHGFEQYLVD